MSEIKLARGSWYWKIEIYEPEELLFYKKKIVTWLILIYVFLFD